MRRHGALLLGLALASCTTEPTQTTETAQSLKDCTPGGNFKDATMIAQPWWNGAQAPAPIDKENYVIWMEPQGTYWNALLANPSTGKIDYAVMLTLQQQAAFLAQVGPYGRIDVGHVPPLPDPDGGNWNARFALELALRLQPIWSNALTASQP